MRVTKPVHECVAGLFPKNQAYKDRVIHILYCCNRPLIKVKAYTLFTQSGPVANGLQPS